MGGALFGFLVYVLLASGDADYWAGDIAEFERADISNPPPKGAIVFAGGGTIRRWDDLEAAMSPMPVIARGFGGAHVTHVAAYADRIINPYEPAAVVISAGGDDLADVGGMAPESVAADMEVLIAKLRPQGEAGSPDPHIYLMAIKPAPMREARWPSFKAANDRFRALADARRDVTFIDVASPLFDEGGQIEDDYFRWDGLTLNEAGYRKIGTVVRAQLLEDLGDRYEPDTAPVPDPLQQQPPAP